MPEHACQCLFTQYHEAANTSVSSPWKLFHKQIEKPAVVTVTEYMNHPAL